MCIIRDMNPTINVSPDNATVPLNNIYFDGYTDEVEVEDKNNHTVMCYYLLHILQYIKQKIHVLFRSLWYIAPTKLYHIKNTVKYLFMHDALKDIMGSILLQHKGHTNKEWVPIDSQLTIDLFYNTLLLTNICQVDHHLYIFYNARRMKKIWWGTQRL